MTKKDDVDLAIINTKMDFIKEKVTKIEANLDKINEKIDAHDIKLTSLETKSGLMAGILTIFTVISSSIAAFLGIKN